MEYVCCMYFLLGFIIIFLHWAGNSVRLYGRWRILHWHVYILTRKIEEQLVIPIYFYAIWDWLQTKAEQGSCRRQQIFMDGEKSNPAAHFPYAKPGRQGWALAAVEQRLLLGVGFTADIGCQLLRRPWARSICTFLYVMDSSFCVQHFLLKLK